MLTKDLSLIDISVDQPYQTTGFGSAKTITMVGEEHPTAMTSEDTPSAMTETKSQASSLPDKKSLLIGVLVSGIVLGFAYFYSKKVA